jgi:protein-S-isoprenylcysteine O-methyltransferase Ste14
MQVQLLSEYPFLLPLLGGFIVGAGAFSLRRASLVLSVKIWPVSWLLAALSSGSFLWSFNWAWGLEESPEGGSRQLLVIIGWICLVGGFTVVLWGLSALGMRAILPRPKDRIETRPPYAYLRRPIALGFIIAALGTSLIVGTPQAWVCFGVWLVLSQILLEIEEWELRNRIPAAIGYHARTPRYIPRDLFGRDQGSHN